MHHRLAAVTAVSVLALGAVGCTDATTPATPPAPGPATQATETETTAPDTASPTPSADAQERNEAAMRAIATAAEAANGTAFEIDDELEDDTWEVDVMAGDRAIEVKVSSDGNTVQSQGPNDDPDLDPNTEERLTRATVTLEQAVETATNDTQGVLDQAELGEEDGQDVWKVTIDTPEIDDSEVYVSTTDAGTIIQADR